jgi:hypothetical protein
MLNEDVVHFIFHVTLILKLEASAIDVSQSHGNYCILLEKAFQKK